MNSLPIILSICEYLHNLNLTQLDLHRTCTSFQACYSLLTFGHQQSCHHLGTPGLAQPQPNPFNPWPGHLDHTLSERAAHYITRTLTGKRKKRIHYSPPPWTSPWCSSYLSSHLWSFPASLFDNLPAIISDPAHSTPTQNNQHKFLFQPIGKIHNRCLIFTYPTACAF